MTNAEDLLSNMHVSIQANENSHGGNLSVHERTRTGEAFDYHTACSYKRYNFALQINFTTAEKPPPSIAKQKRSVRCATTLISDIYCLQIPCTALRFQRKIDNSVLA